MNELAFESAVSLATKVREKEISCVELLQMYLNRTDQFNPSLNAIIVERREEAMSEAQAADDMLAHGETKGPLHGVPMTIKESYDVAGMPTTWGVPDLKDNIATEDALSVRRLKDAGAILYGKTNVPLMLSDFQSYNEIYGTTNNPWDTNCIPGGSSGGSAASLAAGLAGIESGSDIGGSIRNPAHYCGVFGHKPTWNLLPPRGHATPGVKTPSDISVIGPLARSAHDLEVAVQVMAGPDEIWSRGLTLKLPKLEKSVNQLRVAVWNDDNFAPVDSEVCARVNAVADTLSGLGATVDYEARPEFASEHTHQVYQFLLQATMSARLSDADFESIQRSVFSLSTTDQSLNATIRRGQVATFRDWTKHNEMRTHIRWAWHEFFGRFDVVLMPIMASATFPHQQGPMRDRTITVNGEPQDYFQQIFWAGICSNAYLPGTIIPGGLSTAGLPIGVQIAGPEYGDLITIGVAKLLEREGFEFRQPPGYA